VPYISGGRQGFSGSGSSGGWLAGHVAHGYPETMKSVKPTAEAHAFAVMAVGQYGRQLHAFLRRRVWRPEELDDLVQEVYLRLLRVDDADKVRNPLAYIYGVAAHVASEFNMRGHKGKVVFDSSAVEASMDEESGYADRPSMEGGAFFERHVSDALRQLSARHLAVLLLERRDGLTHAQIAGKLDLSVHTVKKYSVQALAHVRASLER
jgi:RNA polymerase sigma factor (sigma-70 family)